MYIFEISPLSVASFAENTDVLKGFILKTSPQGVCVLDRPSENLVVRTTQRRSVLLFSRPSPSAVVSLGPQGDPVVPEPHGG